jgi:hypothetical protein
MKKKRLSAISVKYTINMISLAIFVISYMYIYTEYLSRTKDTYTEIGLVKQQIKTTMNKIANEDEISDKTNNIEADIQNVLERYPVYISKVDNLLFIKQMESDLNMDIKMVDSTDSSSFYDTGLPVRGTVDEGEPKTMTGLEAIIALNFQTDYKGLKKMINYIVNYPEHTTIDSLSVSRDDTTNSLTGSLVIKRYALSGTGKKYEQPVIDDISIGTDDIFGINSDDEQ